MNGIINVLKPAGMTSHDVIGVMRKTLGIKRIGHTGTLDPMAVGVLPICIGSATRMIEYLDGDYKKYRCEMQLGLETDTQDIWGKTVNNMPVQASGDDIASAVLAYKGHILQTPPDYSAVRVQGRHLYEYARSGETVEVKPRWIHIRDISVVSIDLRNNRVLFDVTSSRGTYIRTICTEIGKALGTCAAMSFLVRTASGRFTLENTLTFEEIHALNQAGLLEGKLLPLDFPLEKYPSLFIKDLHRAKAFMRGGPLDFWEVSGSDQEADLNCGELYKVYYEDVFIAMAKGHVDSGKIVSEKVFCQEIK